MRVRRRRCGRWWRGHASTTKGIENLRPSRFAIFDLSDLARGSCFEYGFTPTLALMRESDDSGQSPAGGRVGRSSTETSLSTWLAARPSSIERAPLARQRSHHRSPSERKEASRFEPPRSYRLTGSSERVQDPSPRNTARQVARGLSHLRSRALSETGPASLAWPPPTEPYPRPRQLMMLSPHPLGPSCVSMLPPAPAFRRTQEDCRRHKRWPLVLLTALGSRQARLVRSQPRQRRKRHSILQSFILAVVRSPPYSCAIQRSAQGAPAAWSPTLSATSAQNDSVCAALHSLLRGFGDSHSTWPFRKSPGDGRARVELPTGRRGVVSTP